MKENYLYLPFKALGDFIITASIVKNYFAPPIPVLLPNYLKEMFFEFDIDAYFEVVDYLEFPEYPKLFELHKIKTIKHIKAFINDYRIIASLDKKKHYVVDTHCRRLFLSRVKFIYPNIEGNVYQERLKLLSEIFNFGNVEIGFPFATKAINKVTIFPGSRKKTKQIDVLIVKEIQQYFQRLNIDIKVAYHVSEVPDANDNTFLIFKDFTDLKDTITKSDFIISSDSLPLHLAYYLIKPHYCLYNNIPNIQWLTPFGIANDFFSVVTSQSNFYGKDIVKKILEKGFEFGADTKAVACL